MTVFTEAEIEDIVACFCDVQTRKGWRLPSAAAEEMRTALRAIFVEPPDNDRPTPGDVARQAVTILEGVRDQQGSWREVKTDPWSYRDAPGFRREQVG